MERILLVFLQTLLFLITCSVTSQVLELTAKNSNATPLMNHPWFHSSHNKDLKILRETMDPDSLNMNENTESPPTKRDCVCSKIYDPVCASNNESYFNLCFLECKVSKSDNVSVIHQGNCIPF